ncbi:hypothetical protein K0B03_04505 [Patescibacteria group bacterium]|nr:hypothetical protein [Patescibacteria group bacterium]
MQKQNSHNLPKFIITMSIILLIGTLLGSVFYLLNKTQAPDVPMKKIEQNQNDKISNDLENENIGNEIETSDWQTYQNEEYGFEITLLDSWKGYSILTESWNGTTLDEKSLEYQGPKIVIRNSKWSESQSWQDIPILVFTKSEWHLIEDNNLNISAAPIGPSKLAENQKYVFVLPPRWVGFSDVLGQDEAQKIVKTFKAISMFSDDTSDWKIYKNEEYGYEVKCPNDWDINNTSTDYNLGANSFIEFTKKEGDFTYRFELYVFDSFSDQKWYAENDLDQIEHITIDNKISATKGQTKYDVSPALVGFWTYSSRTYLLRSLPHMATPEFKEIFNQILSTFKFIENVNMYGKIPAKIENI